MNALAWRLARAWICLRRGRIPPKAMPDPVWYFAYGSNMNERLFRERRHMTPIEARIGRLDGYRLCFSIGGGMRPGISAPADIVEAPGHAVHGVLYLLPPYKTPWPAPEGRPGRRYFELIREAARQRGLPAEYVAFLDAVAPRD